MDHLRHNPDQINNQHAHANGAIVPVVDIKEYHLRDTGDPVVSRLMQHYCMPGVPMRSGVFLMAVTPVSAPESTGALALAMGVDSRRNFAIYVLSVTAAVCVFRAMLLERRANGVLVFGVVN